MVTTSDRIPAISLIASLLLISNLYAYWGVRDVPSDLPDIRELRANGVILSISWDECEIEDGEFDWAWFDSLILFNRSQGFNSSTLVIDIVSRIHTNSERRAPDDTDFDTPLAEAIPDSGYSPALFRFTTELCERLIEIRNPFGHGLTLILEDLPVNDWVTTDSTYTSDVEGYIRCVRTIHEAIADIDADQRYSRFDLYMGAVDIAPILEWKWFLFGEGHQELQDSLLYLENAFHLRDSLNFADWDEFRGRATSTEVTLARAWCEALALEWRVFPAYNFKYTFDPQYLHQFTTLLQEQISNAGGPTKRYFSTYGGLELKAGSPIEFSEHFHLVDYLKRCMQSNVGDIDHTWPVSGVYFPLIGADPEHVFGLLNNEGEAYPTLQIMQNIQIQGMPADSSYGRVNFYRFVEVIFDGPSFSYDYVWLQDPLPNEPETTRVGLTRPIWNVEDWGWPWDPGHWHSVHILNIYGDTLADITDRFAWGEEGEAGAGWVDVSPEPIIIAWYLYGSGVADGNPIAPATFTISNIYPNPFNSSLSVEFIAHRPGEYELELIGLDGRRISSRSIDVAQPGERQESFALPNLPSGEYLVRLKNGGEAVGKKVVLLK